MKLQSESQFYLENQFRFRSQGTRRCAGWRVPCAIKARRSAIDHRHITLAAFFGAAIDFLIALRCSRRRAAQYRPEFSRFRHMENHNGWQLVVQRLGCLATSFGLLTGTNWRTIV